MSLEMRAVCEKCNAGLPHESEAYICSFECTFCVSCADGDLAGRCPNCGGVLQTRPTREAKLLGDYPAATVRTFHPPG